jgi:hypothetical protein
MLMVFNEDGRVEFTRNSKLLDIAPPGRLVIKRMTEILFDPYKQLYYIKFLKGRFQTMTLRWSSDYNNRVWGDQLSQLWWTFLIEHSPALAREKIAYGIVPKSHDVKYEGPVYFNRYEDAVDIEIAFIDMLREQGFSMQ